MIKLLRTALLLFFTVLSSSLMAQLKTVNGTVTDAKNEPVASATVTVKGTKRATQTNGSGFFSIQAQKGEVLVISSVGLRTTEVKVGDGNAYNTRLQNDESMMQEVTVTAMDIKRNKRELGYSAQSVGGDDIKESQRENFVNGLAGRVAGLTINPTGADAGASTSIVLRGFNSLALSNQPLFVVDGVVMDNQTMDQTSDGGRGVGLASDRPNRNSDYTNRIADLNPNDIENVTVLKGPEATALYGSQASSGAIIITTKKAKSNKFALQYDNAFRVSKITRFPQVMDKYDNGNNGISANVFAYFGPEFPKETVLFDNIRTFFQTGFSQTHNLGMDFGIKKSLFRISGSVFDQDGTVPNNSFKRYNLRISNTTKIGNNIDIIPTIAYIRSENNKVLRSAGGYLLTLMQWPNENSILNMEDAQGSKIPLFSSNASSEIDNPFFNVYKNKNRDVTDRITTTLGINLRPTNWLSIQGRFGYDQYNMEGHMLIHPLSSSNGTATVGLGSLDNFWRKYRGYNHTITATATKKVGKFGFRAMVGTMWQDYETKMFAVYGTTLKNPTITDSSNTAENTRIRLLRNNNGEYNQNIIRQLAYFGEAAISYNNMIFLNYTHRFEQASTLPKKNRNYNYPGMSLSLIMNDIIPGLKTSNILNYWKLRTSLAGTARLNSPYSTQSVFVNNFASGGGFSYGYTNANPDLYPEKQSTYEIGTELRLFNNKISLDATYYNTLNKGQIIENFRLSYGTGFVLNTQNAASTRNRGIELSLGGPVISKRNFGWNFQLNFNKMWNKVIDMPRNISEYYIADTWLYGAARGGLVFGGPTTSITANGYARNDKGQILINPNNGLPVVDANYVLRGDRNPDFTLGFVNSFRYKGWKFNMLWDIKVGGDIFNGTGMFLTRIGRNPLTTSDRMIPRVIEGVLNDGKQNTATPTINTIRVTPYYNDAYYTTMPEEVFIQKNVNWARLRDLSLSYTFKPNPFIDYPAIKNIEIFATANDLILITNYLGADPQSNGNTAGSKGVGGFGFDYGALPAPVSINFGLRAGF